METTSRLKKFISKIEIPIKIGYLIFIVILIVTWIFVIIILKSSLGFSEWVSNSANITIAVAATITAVIALGVADKPPRYVKFEVELEIDKQSVETYNPNEYIPIFDAPSKGDPNYIRYLSNNKPFQSYRVYFRIKNSSKFTLKYPVITFKLPISLRHPAKTKEGNEIPDYHSNLFNVQTDLRTFIFGETIILSNNILPFLNDNEDLPIWIRMCLSEDDTDQYDIFISLNCENAEGSTKMMKLIPSDLLKRIQPPQPL